ncbi:hypothetical protein PUN28_016605 [Cardiocondyla obscurior]|uniref:Uncharacterized protein n=1 Tax=Cardiocondyla obscurior TaxID=286306 RepID=A0AAW2EMU1_9HYME
MAIVTKCSENTANDINLDDYVLDTELHKVPAERQILNFRKNGIKVNVKVIPTIKNDTAQKKEDYFPEFPMRDIGKCIIEFSLTCIKKRFVRFLETVSLLDEITLVGQDVKLVKSATVRRSEARSMNDTDVSVQRTVDDFFDSFTLRITLPTWNSKREKNQIDVMFDDAPAVEGRKKSGCGGGGGKGGKCKMMMMGMMMMMKLKLIALAAMKSMMMGGMSLMLSMMMYMKGKGGGGGGGPWKGGGGDSYKEIVLLTKSSGGGGGGQSDSYGAPPPSSYGPPSGGGGGYGGGGSGWGRSFHKPMIHDGEIKTEIANGPNHIPMTGEVASNAGSIDYLDYQDYQESPSDASSLIFNWNAPNYTVYHQDGDSNVSTGLARNNLRSKATVDARGRSLIFDEDPINPVNVANLIEKNVAATSTTDRPVAAKREFTTNTVHMDEWQATVEKTSSSKASPTNKDTGNELRQTELRAKDIPLLREI